MTPPPSLPRRFNDTPLMLAVGSALWAVVSLVLLAAALTGARPLDVWFATSVAGWLLGLIGYGIFRWQRAAADRGSRGAQEGFDG